MSEDDRIGGQFYRREIVKEFHDKLHDLARYYMAEHDLSTIEIIGALALLQGSLIWVYAEVQCSVPTIYREQREASGNSGPGHLE